MKYILKRKRYSDGDDSQSNVGKKLLIGAGLAAAAGGSFAAARRGIFGANTAKSANNAWMSWGNKLASKNNKTFQKWGKGMIDSGAARYSDAYKTNFLKNGESKLSDSAKKEIADKRAAAVENRMKAYYSGNGIKAKEGSQLASGTGYVSNPASDIEKYRQDRAKRLS